jgi:TRAP-type transport system small permease protein
MARSKMRALISFADRITDHSFSVILVVGGALVVLTVVLQVILRYVFKVPLFGLEELSRLIAVWLYFIGAVFGTKYDSHVQGDVAERLFTTARAKAMVKTVAWILSLLVCILFLYHAAKYSVWLYHTGERTTGLWWPRIYSVASMSFGALFMTLYSIANVVKFAAKIPQSVSVSSGGAS